MKQKVFSLLLATVFLSTGLLAQGKFFTKTGKVYFNCTGGIEPIEGTNKSTTCVLDSKSGAIQFSMLMKGFEFEKQLMMEHFNENYVETEKFPKATFVGQIANNSEINYAKDGTYPAKVARAPFRNSKLAVSHLDRAPVSGVAAWDSGRRFSAAPCVVTW